MRRCARALSSEHRSRVSRSTTAAASRIASTSPLRCGTRHWLTLLGGLRSRRSRSRPSASSGCCRNSLPRDDAKSAFASPSVRLPRRRHWDGRSPRNGVCSPQQYVPVRRQDADEDTSFKRQRRRHLRPQVRHRADDGRLHARRRTPTALGVILVVSGGWFSAPRGDRSGASSTALLEPRLHRLRRRPRQPAEVHHPRDPRRT